MLPQTDFSFTDEALQFASLSHIHRAAELFAEKFESRKLVCDGFERVMPNIHI